MPDRLLERRTQSQIDFNAQQIECNAEQQRFNGNMIAHVKSILYRLDQIETRLRRLDHA